MSNLINQFVTDKTTITAPSTHVCTLSVIITPDVAQTLVNQTDTSIQRSSKKAQILYLADQMQMGKWQFNGDAIRQDKLGNIIDGFHRLKACISANKPFKTLLVKGLETESIKTIDQAGASRTLGDYVSIAYGDSKYTNATAAAIQKINLIQSGVLGVAGDSGAGGRNKRRKIDTVAIDDFIAKEPKFFDFVADNCKLRAQGDKLLMPSLFVALAYIFEQANPMKAQDFMAKLSLGIGVSADCPIFFLRSRLIKSKATKGTSHKMTGKQQIIAIIQTWNLYVSGKKARKSFSYTSTPKILTGNLI